MSLWLLFILLPFAAIAAILWNYRRKQSARAQRSDERWQSLVINRSPVPQAAAAAVPGAASSPGLFRPRERVLDPAHTLLYFLLRSGLPDCEVLTQVTLDRLLVDAGGAAAGFSGLAQHRVDFVVCDKGMRPLAAVDLLESEAPASLTTAPDFATRCLAQSGIRHVRLVRTALPKRDALRAVVLGP